MICDYLVCSELNACIRNDTQQVGEVSSIKTFEPLVLQYVCGAVNDARILSSYTQSHAGLYYLSLDYMLKAIIVIDLFMKI